MRIPKRYGEGMIDRCPFCKKQATVSNSQGIPVCQEHKTSNIGEMKCVCGRYLDIRQGKFGIFFSCLHCGNINRNKIFEINDVTKHNGLGALGISANPQKDKPDPSYKPSLSKGSPSKNQREVTIRADDPLYFD